MRLDFNVLWVDDQPDRISAQIKPIARKMEEEGFQFNPTLCRSMAEVREHVKSGVFNDEVDLILVDWDLGTDVAGQQAIAEIREHILYKDVVFYSANSEPDKLRKLAFDAGLEGVYCASRMELVEEVIGVFESLVKKVLDLDHTRGIVMGATSDIDYMVSECLVLIHERLDGEGKQKMLLESVEYIAKKVEKYSERAKTLKESTSISMADLLKEHGIFTAHDRLRILSRLLKDYTDKTARVAITTYMEKVVPDRNILGHQVLVPEGKAREVIDSQGQPISLEKTRELRRLILVLRTDFRSLLAALRAPS